MASLVNPSTGRQSIAPLFGIQRCGHLLKPAFPWPVANRILRHADSELIEAIVISYFGRRIRLPEIFTTLASKLLRQ